MYKDDLAKTDFTSYLNMHDQKDLLRFITCGSVDDGKSTLIGRLLYESQLIYDDQLCALTKDSKKFGTTNEELDLALLVDGLIAEREQGITIDVAYRYFTTAKRKFIVADTPGHEQYTRNMATGASTAHAAVIIIDARKGVLTQTRRHSFIVNMLGVQHLILAVNKMDLVQYDQNVYERIKTEYQQFAQSLGIQQVYSIPISALKEDNVVKQSSHMPWYQGPSLLQYLEEIPVESSRRLEPFRMAVQWVNRPHLDFRGITGRVISGTIKPGDTIKILPGNQQTTVSRIVSYDGDLQQAQAGQSITITVSDELDISRGDMLCSAEKPCEVADQFAVSLLWMSETPMVASRQYLFKSNTMTTLCTLGKPKHCIDMHTLSHLATNDFRLNDIGDCDLFLERSIAYSSYKTNKELGSFILIDRLTHATVAAGFIHSQLRYLSQSPGQAFSVNKNHRAAIKGQKPVVLWFTGLSGSGKSTIANLVEYELNLKRKHSMLLDGDLIRHGLNRDLDFSVSGRAENIRRVIEIAKLMVDAGLITLVSFISPFQEERDRARKYIGQEQFLELFVDAPLAVVEQRDVKGLYKKARLGEITEFTGISSPYEAPLAPDLHINTEILTPHQAMQSVIELLVKRNFIG
ncbi:sulfate adenylyltransferase subunit CysN [Legionella fallonii]|uniref:Multifunctional fusion protein n=1 Tax=Legionella fallonii LLAP-10 TaxID=1212491 RepID=A0A098G164_9GAMM|nr:sulfate adenylyltransferase subunit CysN [Legionella fallonii]CEG56223.1 Bifunctional enzyme CysN/CysC [Includes: Sulfate adenylyltransferase subunit 1; Adenylyl-sulfate kinase] [Legionella fallonii LLAP-10]